MRSISVAVLLGLAAVLASLTLPADLMARQMNVQVRQGELRRAPSFLGPVVGRLSYGQPVTVREEKGPWSRVAVPPTGLEGWIHTSSLTAKTIKLQAGSRTAAVSANSDELALGGKGFNRQVEETFRRRNPTMDFTWVDRMEKYRVSDRQIRAFLEAGQLHPQGGL